MVSQLVIHDVPIECVNQAAVRYHVPATIILSILQVEQGHVGLAKPNPNHTVDYGPMQINSIWIKTLAAYGISRQELQYNPCTNVAVGAWILSQKIAESKDLWQGIAAYHSGTPSENKKYRYAVTQVYLNMIHVLQQA